MDDPKTSPPIEYALREREEKIAEQEQEIRRLKAEIEQRDLYINHVANSWNWKLGQSWSRLRQKLAPNGSKRERVYRWITWPLRGTLLYGASGMLQVTVSRMTQSAPGRWTINLLKSLLPGSLRDFLDQFHWELRLPDHSQVTMFASPEILPEYEPRRTLEAPTGGQPVKVSLISTTLNEAGNVEVWLDSLLQQSRLPDEIVITDGGSTDGTAEMIRSRATSFPIPIRVIDAPGANIARGRNIAIEQTRYDVIASADFGGILGEGWLRNLILPFEAEPGIEVSCGFSKPVPGDEFGRRAARYLIPALEVVKPQQFLPSSRSLAFRKEVWQRTGGYPEWLSFAGEDTLFDRYAKLQAGKWAFVPEAVVYWHAPGNLEKLYRTQYRYSKGDGESGLFASLYWGKLAALIWKAGFYSFSLIIYLAAILVAWLLFEPWVAAGLAGAAGLLALIWLLRRLHMHSYNIKYLSMAPLVYWAQLRGFAAGVKERPAVNARRASQYKPQLQQILDAHPDRKGIIVYPPTHDWGYMFQLPQQMARVFARRGYLFFYCTNNEVTDDVIGFGEVEPNLVVSHVPLETFGGLQKPILYLGSPWHRRAIKLFNQPLIIYDYYDDLKVSSGRVEDFDALVAEADVIIVTAERLLDDVKARRSDAVFVPNGVDLPYILSRRPAENQPAPDDWLAVALSGKPVIGYSGSMAERFDYDLLRYLVENRPDLEFVLIGTSYDGSLERSGLLRAGFNNLRWLGMKSYAELFPYMWRFDVGIIPFKINQITQATTSIKLFEYMACEVPVVSTAMPESKRYPGVLIGETYAQFGEMLDRALALGNDPEYLATIRAVAGERSWDKRADAILEKIKTRSRQS
jgi:glycosyltransferase involved in cell wall biosynthesis